MKKPAKKKKTSKQKLEDILGVAAEELNTKDFPFQGNIPKNIIAITPEEITQELSSVKNKEVSIIIPENTEENDFEFARTTLYNLIQKASRVTDNILNLCEEMGHPRAYEVAGQLIKTTSEVTKDLISLRKTQSELKKNKLPGDDILPDMTENKNGDTYILSGTTSDILDAIRKSKEEKGNNK